WRPRLFSKLTSELAAETLKLSWNRTSGTPTPEPTVTRIELMTQAPWALERISEVTPGPTAETAKFWAFVPPAGKFSVNCPFASAPAGTATWVFELVMMTWAAWVPLSWRGMVTVRGSLTCPWILSTFAGDTRMQGTADTVRLSNVWIHGPGKPSPSSVIKLF